MFDTFQDHLLSRLGICPAQMKTIGQDRREAIATAIPGLMLPAQVRIGPCDLPNGDGTVKYVVLGRGKGVL